MLICSLLLVSIMVTQYEIFLAKTGEDGEVQTCQNGACDLDRELENKVKIQRSINFDWPYLRIFLLHNQNVWCSENISPVSL